MMKRRSPQTVIHFITSVLSVTICYGKNIDSQLSADHAKHIILKENELQSLQLPFGQSVIIACPFENPQWYHNEQILNGSKIHIIDYLSTDKSGLYSCIFHSNNTLGIKWANTSLAACESANIFSNRKLDIRRDIDKLRPKTGSPPKFQNDQFEENIEKHCGELVSFNCTPSKHSDVDITWSFNDDEINNSTKKRLFRKWSLSIANLEASDSGVYTCQLCNVYGCMSRSYRLKVGQSKFSHPRIVDGVLRNQSVSVDSNTSFECRVVSDLESRVLVWYKHDSALSLTNSTEFELKTQIAEKMITQSDEPHILKLGSVQKEDEGWYTCVVTNTQGETAASAYLTVNDIEDNSGHVQRNTMSELAPELSSLNLEILFDGSADHEIEIGPDSDISFAITFQQVNDESLDTDTADKKLPLVPEFKNVKRFVDTIHKPSGSSLQLLCPAKGNPMPNITWTRNGTVIDRHIGKVNYKKWSIQMDDAITEDSGVYTCRICNIHGCIEHSTKITIFDRLRSRPIISDKFPQNQTVLTNSSTSLECRVVSDLEPFIYWLTYSQRNESVDELEKIAQNYASHGSINQTIYVIVPERDPDKPNILSLSNVTHKDEGWYTCVAASSLGTTVASAYLKVVDQLQKDSLQRSHPVWITTVGVVVVLLLLLGTVFIIYVLRNLKHEKLLKQRIETVHQWTKKVIIYKPPASENGSCDLQMPVIKIEKQRTTFTTSSNSDPSQGFNEYEFPIDSNWEIPRGHLSLGSTLGEGAFGRVVMAQGSGFSRASANASATTIVAVKMVKEEHTDADMASLVREMEVMKMIGKHVNIINLLGCCSQNGPLWVIVEFALHGNLKDFLKKNRSHSGWGSSSLKRSSEYLEEKPMLTEKHLTSFAFQIGRGMEYLASRRCIHRDLAARNVLVSDDYVMKIADFGLARDIQDTDYYRKNTNGRLPIKWMAPESLQEKFYDSQSDVWSYGVLLWEIMTYGDQPYPNIMSAEELYSYLITGQRMEKPPRCSLNIYMLMRQCWHFDSNARPTFSEIVENLDKLLQLSNITSNEEYLDLTMPMLETPPSSSDEESDNEAFRQSSPVRYQYTYKFN